MKHINIPVFIPHLGCPNLCVFCNQRTISGTSFFNENKVKEIIDEVLLTCNNAEAEIAYFGGSFTGIDRKLMLRLLDTAQSYVGEGKVIGIRMSTRPDYIDNEIVEILKNYTISQVELGIQSMSDCVLYSSKRGHTAKKTKEAITLLINAGFDVVGQMMIGLPGADIDDEIMTAEAICDLGCKASRIYPTVVFKDTELYSMMKNGTYSPLTLEDAVERSAQVLGIFERRGVNCLRIGLCDSDNLHSETSYAAGPNHSALGELVMSRVFYNRISAELEKLKSKGTELSKHALKIECSRGAVSKVIGNKKCNKLKISHVYNINKLNVVENPELLGYNVRISLE